MALWRLNMGWIYRFNLDFYNTNYTHNVDGEAAGMDDQSKKGHMFESHQKLILYYYLSCAVPYCYKNNFIVIKSN